MPNPERLLANSHGLRRRLERVFLVGHQSNSVALELLSIPRPPGRNFFSLRFAHHSDLLQEIYPAAALSESAGLSQGNISNAVRQSPSQVSPRVRSSARASSIHVRFCGTAGNTNASRHVRP